MGTFALEIEDFSATRAVVASGLGEEFANVSVAIMNDVAFPTLGVASADGGMLFDFGETKSVVAVETHQIVGIPAAAFEPTAADIVASA